MNGEWVRVTRKRPCPQCGKPTWCLLTADGNRALCMRVESDKPTRNRGWLHILSESTDFRPKPITRPIVHSHPPAEPVRLDFIYTQLIRAHLVLSEDHRAKLTARGLTDVQVDANGYCSVPTPLYGRTVARLLSPHDLRGVPGFYREQAEWRMVTPGPGFLVPVRDSQRRIRGFQVRMDEGDTRYLWFSSASKPEGQSSGAPLHFAQPELIPMQRQVFITEGALKADVISARLNAPVIGLPGVTTWPGGFGRGLRRLFPSLSKIFLCFDSDFKTNEHVRRALFSLLVELRSALYSPSVLTWDAAKGFDDYLTRKAA
jgi:hypothetical protein